MVNNISNRDPHSIVIGVLGGMGSFATLNIFEQVLKEFPADKEWERPRIVIDNRCTMPSRVRAILYNEKKDEVFREITESLMLLANEARCSDIIVACNTAHFFLESILLLNPNLSNKVHNIIDACMKETKMRGINKVYLIASEGTIDAGVYLKYAQHYGIEVLNPTDSEQSQIRGFIECVKQNKYKEDDLKAFSRFVKSLPCDNVILGCTELPVLYQNSIKQGFLYDVTMIDPIECAIKEIKEKFLNS